MRETAVIAIGLGVALGLLGTIDLSWAAFGVAATVTGIIGGGVASLRNSEIPSIYSAIEERSRTAESDTVADENAEEVEKNIKA